ncbi:MAG: class I SAM-dependent methyltransferase [Candidatus Bathyarchaeota archaeon]|nr:class I SAM-dependent methyltransferase [Candidatus Bathyarchaeota archaeon]
MQQNQNRTAAQGQNLPLRRCPIRKSELDRFKFGKQAYNRVVGLSAEGAGLCLDVACGAKPFPKADVLCDLYVEPVPDRSMKKLETAGKPFVLCSCYALPFKDCAFEFVTSYYLIEHLAYPRTMFNEMKRVSRHGYIQSPSWLNELFYGESVHSWIVFKKRNQLLLKPLKGASASLRLGFIFHKLYRHPTWQVIHAILDEKLHLFTVRYDF